MLVLTRTKNQRIQIGDSITITIVRVDGRTVRIGIDAPREMEIVRDDAIVRTRKETPDG